MKKLTINIAILLAALFSITACTKQLDQDPQDKISTGNFWQRKGDFDQALAACYSTLQAAQWSVELPVWDCFTDDGYAQHGSGGAKEVVAGSISPSTGGYIQTLYTDSYKGIARVNNFLVQLKAYTNADMTDEDKQRYEGEVRFLRGFFYFQLYWRYGAVPLVLEPLTLETQLQPKVPAADILKQVLEDLDFAITHLNAKPYYQNGGHAAVTSAQALKMRVLLNAAYGASSVPDAALMTQVRDLAQQIQASYSLSPNFEDIFRDATQKNNPEIIFAVNYLPPNNAAPWDMYYGDWVVASPLQNFVNDFECTDGLPYGVSPLTNPNAPFENRDPRLKKTVYVDHPDFGGGRIHTPSNSRPTGYGVIKFLVPENIPYGFSTLSGQNAVVIRLAEILLTYAEAQNELAGPDASVYKAMTDLRARVGMPPYPAGLTKDQMRQRIRHERRIELAFEGLRFFDLIRWHIAGQVLNNVKDGIANYHWEDRFAHWPLPQSEIDKSGGVLEQNPDYK